MITNQQGRYAIYNVSCTENKFVVDHNHDTDKVRELLCSNCNTGFGLFHESPIRLLQVTMYTFRHNEITEESREVEKLMEAIKKLVFDKSAVDTSFSLGMHIYILNIFSFFCICLFIYIRRMNVNIDLSLLLPGNEYLLSYPMFVNK
jgi:hypothetical protein